MRRLIAVSALIVSSASGCHCQDPDAVACPCASVPSPPKEAQSVNWLPERALDGVFPPAWRPGMQWRVSVTAYRGADGVYQPHPVLLTRIYRFRVAEVPSELDPEFQLEVRPDWMSRSEPTIMRFRSQDASFSSSKSGLDHRNREHPFVETAGFLGLLAFPALPVEQRNPYLFISRTDGTQQPGKQMITVQPEGVMITIEIDESPFSYVKEAVVEWKRGEPWPASVHLWNKTREDRSDSGDDSQGRSFVASSELIHDP